jgi:hypothetical protein
MPGVHPLHQGAAGMQRNAQIVVLEDLQEWQVAVLISLLEDRIKIPDGLMIM